MGTISQLGGARKPQPVSIIRIAVLALVMLVLQLAGSVAADGTKCNGFSELCSRKFNEVSFVSTRASFATIKEGSKGDVGTQYKDIKQQLEDGVRGFHFPLFKNAKSADKVNVCFLDCDVVDGGDLTTHLKTIKEWMDANKNDVVSVFLEGPADGVSPAAVKSAIVDSGIDDLVLKGKPEVWPTLDAMIKRGTRAVVFVEEPAISDALAGYCVPYGGTVLKLDGKFAYGDEWTCGPWTRSTESILLIPHFISQNATINDKTYSLLPYPFKLDLTNGYQFEFHAINCRGSQSIWISFVEVDYYDKGDVWTPTLKFNSLPFKGDSIDNFYPKFYKGTVDVKEMSKATSKRAVSVTADKDRSNNGDDDTAGAASSRPKGTVALAICASVLALLLSAYGA